MSAPPQRSTELPTRSRGVIALVPELCTSCMICARECPDWCIHIEAHTEAVPPAVPETPAPAQPATAPMARRPARERTRTVLDRFAMDFGLCMYCGICIEVCPFDALHWSAEHTYAGADPRDLLHEQDRLASWLSSVPPPPPLDVAGAPPIASGGSWLPKRP
ncbi:MAG: 4Fe-4S binding protein [Dermatophilaceae bacterium]